jgi:hypothetical protein
MDFIDRRIAAQRLGDKTKKNSTKFTGFFVAAKLDQLSSEKVWKYPMHNMKVKQLDTHR